MPQLLCIRRKGDSTGAQAGYEMSIPNKVTIKLSLDNHMLESVCVSVTPRAGPMLALCKRPVLHVRPPPMRL